MILANQLVALRDYIHNVSGIFLPDNLLASVYKKKIETFMRYNNYDSFDRFFQDLRSSSKRRLFESFINSLTVNETYFFREEHQFKTLVDVILPQLDKIRPPDENIDILSAPSSSGEELYSIAIYILENAHLARKRNFHLVGIDIDTQILQKAKAGIYSKRSISTLSPELVDKYFKKDAEHYKIVKEIKENVEFVNVNVMDHYAMLRLGKFDVIFSRNMLIYFSDKARRSILATFYSMLKDGGYLFLGHAERVPRDMNLFEEQNIDGTIFYKKKGV